MSDVGLQSKPPKRRAKGEKSRRQILEGALGVIARDGLRAATHRAVAKEAGVPLSLTTYYFKDLSALVGEAFDLYVDRAREGTDTIWQAAFNILEDGPSLSEQSARAKRDTVKRLAELGADYIVAKADTSIGPAIEVSFLYRSHMQAPLAARIEDYQLSLEERAVEACRTIGSQDPQTDGALLLGTIQRLEFECLNASTRPDRKRVLEHLQRLIQLIVG